MANHKSAVKRAKQNKKKRESNKMKESRARTAIKKVRAAIVAKDKTGASELFVTAQSLLAKLAKSGNIKDNNASRKTSRLASQIAKI